MPWEDNPLEYAILASAPINVFKLLPGVPCLQTRKQVKEERSRTNSSWVIQGSQDKQQQHRLPIVSVPSAHEPTKLFDPAAPAATLMPARGRVIFPQKRENTNLVRCPVACVVSPKF